MSYRKHLMTSDEPPSELYKAAEVGTNLAEVGTDCSEFPNNSDTISRQAAIDYFVTNVGFHDEDGYPIEDTDELRKIWTEYFSGIPTAEPKRGRWIDKGVYTYVDDHRHLYKCDQCGNGWLDTPDFCPHCGAKMGGNGMTDIPNTCGECDSSTYSETEKSLVCTLNVNRLHVDNDSRYAFCPLLNKPEPLFSTERARRYLKYELPTDWPIVREVTE